MKAQDRRGQAVAASTFAVSVVAGFWISSIT
jgi:hypothetical protein